MNISAELRKRVYFNLQVGLRPSGIVFVQVRRKLPGVLLEKMRARHIYACANILHFTFAWMGRIVIEEAVCICVFMIDGSCNGIVFNLQ